MPKEISRTTSSKIDFWRNFTGLRVGENGEITARDIESDSGKRNSIFVGDNSTDRLGVALVAIRAKNSALSTSVDTILDLPQGRLIVLAEYLRLHRNLPYLLWRRLR